MHCAPLSPSGNEDESIKCCEEKEHHNPTTNGGGTQNGSSVGICTHCMHVFCTFGTDLYAQSVLNNKISALEITRKFIKRALLVGQANSNIFWGEITALLIFKKNVAKSGRGKINSVTNVRDRSAIWFAKKCFFTKSFLA